MLLTVRLNGTFGRMSEHGVGSKVSKDNTSWTGSGNNLDLSNKTKQPTGLLLLPISV